MNRALFLDRDGVINYDYCHVYQIENFKFIDGVFSLVKKYQDEGYLIFVVSNQAGIAKGMYTQNDLDKLDSYMKDKFKEQGIYITKSYYCPHHPNDNCLCRKPKPGMLLKAKEEFDLDMTNSVLIGDKMSDLEAGFNAGVGKLFFKKGIYSEKKVPFEYEIINY